MDNFDELQRIQRRMQKKLEEEKTMDDTLDMLTLFNELAPHSGQKILREQLLVEGNLRGMQDSHINSVVDQLIRDRMLFVPSPGWLQRR